MAKSNSVEATRRRHEHWRELVARWTASGLSQAEFCRRRGIPVGKLAWWKRRLKGEDAISGPLFVPVHVAPSLATPHAGELELTLRGGRLLRFGPDVDTARLAEIVTALEAAAGRDTADDRNTPVRRGESSPC